MAVKRDYSSFSKACQRHFAPMVADLGMRPLGGAKFGRARDRWIDGLFLQQRGSGSGDFSVTVGFNIPEMDALWQMPSGSFGLFPAHRLSADGVGAGDCWLPASNKEELLRSLQQFAAYLRPVMAWYDEIRTFDDLLEQCGGSVIGTEPPASVSYYQQTWAANHGFTLYLTGRIAEAKAWLLPVEASLLQTRFMTRAGDLVDVKEPGARVWKPSQDEIDLLVAIRSVLSRI